VTTQGRHNPYPNPNSCTNFAVTSSNSYSNALPAQFYSKAAAMEDCKCLDGRFIMVYT